MSSALDTARRGNQRGLADGYALAMSTAGSALPAQGTFGPADSTVQQVAQQAIITAGSQGDKVANVTDDGDNGIAQTQGAVQPLAVLNAPANQGIDAVAGAVDTAATTLGTQIQPFDKTVHQSADLLRGVEAPPGG